MKRIQLTKSEWAKLVLVVVVVTILIALAGIYAGSRRFNQATVELVASMAKDANISMDAVHHRAVRDGVEQWRLDAASAQYSDQKKEAVFDEVNVTFFREDGGEIKLSANRGVLNTQTNNIDVSGNVVMKGDTYQLKTDQLHYDHRRRIIFTKVPVTIVQDESRLLADSMSFRMDDDRLILEGRVHGAFQQDLML